MSDKFGMMDNAYFTGKGEIIKWINTTLKLNITKIEQACTGAIYCQILDVIHPGKVKMVKVNWKATLEHEFINNLKILQQSLSDLGIHKEIDIQKLSKGKYQDNFEILQWLKGYFDNKCTELSNYDPEKRRNYVEFEFGKEKENKKTNNITTHTNTKKTAPQHYNSGNNSNHNSTIVNKGKSKSKDKLATDNLVNCIDKVNIEGSTDGIDKNAFVNNNLANCNTSDNKSNPFFPIQEILPSKEEINIEISEYQDKIDRLNDEVGKNKREINTLKLLLAEEGREREFYYSKLRDLEFLANKRTSIDKAGLLHIIQEILYAEKEVELIIDEYGNPTIKKDYIN